MVPVSFAPGSSSCTASAINHDFAIPGSILISLFLPQTTVLNFLAVLPPPIYATNPHSAFPGSTSAVDFLPQINILHFPAILNDRFSVRTTVTSFIYYFCGRDQARIVLPRFHKSRFVIESRLDSYCHDRTFLLSWQNLTIPCTATIGLFSSRGSMPARYKPGLYPQTEIFIFKVLDLKSASCTIIK